MNTKLIKFLIEIRFKFFLILILCSNAGFSQNCNQSLDFSFSASSTGSGVNWGQFPDFSLPFIVVFGGVTQASNYQKILSSGFTHIANPNDLTGLDPTKRAFIHYGLGVIPNNPQPWSQLRSPWGNDLTAYQNYWNSEITNAKKITNNNSKIDANIFAFDIEQQLKSDNDILALKTANSTPANLKGLADADFVLAYKKALQSLYAQSTQYFKTIGGLSGPNIGSYTDTPILNTFTNIQGKTWLQWKTDLNAINFLNFDFVNNKVGGPLYDNLTLMMPSAYFYYDYPHIFAGEYLPYLMFQVEANRAWTSKDLMLFVWQKFSYTPAYVKKNIRPWMAESMAIFPFMCGAKGIWFWEDPMALAASDNYANYEYFTKGLYRLSKFKSFFEGTYKIVETVSAREYDENKQPIWRGIVNNNQILIAAHNPWATEANTESVVKCNYGSWSQSIKLTGYEVFLCSFNIENQSVGNIQDLVVFPNPNNDQLLKIQCNLLTLNPVDILIHDTNGKLLYAESFTPETLSLNKVINLPNSEAAMVFVTIQSNSEKNVKKVILNP